MDKAKTDKAKSGLVVAVFLLMLLGSQIAGAQPFPRDHYGTVFGRVIGPNGEGVAGIEVGIFQERGWQYLAQTDCSGFYMRFGIKAGNYTVQFAGMEFRLETRNAVHIESAKGTKVDAQMQAGTLTGEHMTVEVSNDIFVSTLITGTVSDPTGVPIPGAQMMAIDEMTGYLQKTTTDQAGYYAFIDPRLGRFGIWASAPGLKQR